MWSSVWKPTWSCPRTPSCSARPIEFGGEPNTELTPVSLGLPGSLPVINKTAVDYAIKLGLALHCEIAEGFRRCGSVRP